MDYTNSQLFFLNNGYKTDRLKKLDSNYCIKYFEAQNKLAKKVNFIESANSKT